MFRNHLSKLTGIVAVVATICGPAVAADGPKVGVTVASLGNPYFAATGRGMAEAAKTATPGAQLIVVSADYDLNKQFTQVDNFIAAGVKIIMLNAVDPVAILPAVRRAEAAGITVAAFDVAAEGASVTVMTDNVKAGAIACQYIVDHLPGEKGKVVILNGPQVSSIRDRVTGCKKTLSLHPGITVLSSDQNAQASREGGLAVGQSLLTRYPHIDAAFAINDPTAIGLDLAAKQLHRTDFFITSVDGSPDAINLLKSRNGLLKATSAQDPAGMAAQAYRLGAKIAAGSPADKQTVLLTPTLVTEDNVAQRKGWND